MLSNNIETFIDFYKNEIRKIIDQIKTKKAINYLNAQVITGKLNNTNIEINNKFNKNEFMNIINHNLTINFDYIAQKYFIYQLLFEFCESYSENIGKEINNIINTILDSSKAGFHYKDIYKQKYNIFEQKIRTEKIFFERNGKNANDGCNLI